VITVQQIENALDEGIPYTYSTWDGKEAEATFNSRNFWYEIEDGEIDLGIDLGIAKFVTGETGGEGSAEHIWLVFSVTNGDSVQYFKKTGYYASYDGSNWDGALVEVEPFEKTVTDWKPAK
jgi:hypothetical protein